MKQNPPDGNPDLQDYLDTLLMQGTEHPDAQVDDVHHAQPEAKLKVEAYSRATAIKARQVAVPAQDKASIIQENAKPFTDVQENAKPFAEPAEPLKLKLPLPKVVPEPTETKAPVVEPPVKPVEEEAQRVVDEPAVESDEHIAKPEGVEWLDNGRPVWAQDRFECLLFSVGGLTLAVPLVELGTIFPMTEELTPLFGQIDWFMGLLPVKEANIKTVNTAKVVMPERYDPEMDQHFNYVISINDVDWGLAVDNVSEAISLDPEMVRWRTERSKRPWLAGTVVDHMCALLDISQLSLMFHEQDRNSRH